MAVEENHFNELMEEFGFKTVTHDFVRFLNRHIKLGNLELHYQVNTPLVDEVFLKNENPSNFAFKIYGKAILKSLDFEAVDESRFYGDMRDELSIGPIYYKSIFSDGEYYYPAHLQGISEFPTQLSEHVHIIGAPNTPYVYVKTLRAPMRTKGISLTKENYEKFKLNYELANTKKTLPRRRAVLKAVLEHDGYDTSRKLVFSEHDYISRKQLWQRLYEFESESGLFSHVDHTTPDKINKLFDGNPYISFDKSKN